MSGTSLDGIDVAVVDIKRSVSTVAHATVPYKAAVRQRILAASSPADVSRLNFELGALYAKAVIATCARSGVALETLDLAGCHGQTIYHDGRGPKANTMQIGEASVLAERLGIPVISDFRTRDIAAGGQGAPLVPFVDFLLFRSARVSRVLLNVGGIANITVLPRGAAADGVIAFDTGPGNMVIDQIVARMTSGRQRFDRGGAIAAGGHVNTGLLDSMLRDPYFTAKPPKTAGREQYGAAFVDKLAGTGLAWKDLAATATAFTAASISAAVTRYAADAEEVIAAGGGVHNSQLMAQIAGFLPGRRITTTDEFGISADAKEAIAFAVLAHRTWHGKTGNLPSATGASKPVVLGKITPAGRPLR